MIQSRPNIARQLSIIAMALLVTLLAALALVAVWILWLRYVRHSSDNLHLIFGSAFPEVPIFVASCGAGTLLASPFLLRFARLTSLRHTALLAFGVVAVTFALLAMDRLDFLEDLLDYLTPGTPGLLSGVVIMTVFPQILHTALGCWLYRAAQHRLHRTRGLDDPSPGSPPPSDHLHRFGSRAELRCLVSIVGGIILIATASPLVMRQIVIGQIPPKIWNDLREPNRVRLFTLKPYLGRTGPPPFLGSDIAGSLDIESEEDREAIIAGLKSLMTRWRRIPPTGRPANYGLQVMSGIPPLSIGLYFDEQRMVIYEGNNPPIEIEIHGGPEVLDDLLRAAGLPTPSTKPPPAGLIE